MIDKLRDILDNREFVSMAEKRRLERSLAEMEEKKRRFERESDMVKFYTLAKKYGFCTPYCECQQCV